MRSKVLVIGLDGATFDLIRPWAKKGKLPNFANLMRNGISGELVSPFPFVTPTSLASFMTGKNPGKHGIIDFRIRQNGSYNRAIVNSTNIDGETLWTILSDAGLKVGVVHVPLTHPPRRVNGFIVSSYILSPSISTYPPNLKEELTREIDGYVRARANVIMYFRGMEDNYLKLIYDITEKEAEATFYLLRKYAWDFFMTYFYWGEQLQHNFWGFMDPEHPAHNPNGENRYGNAILQYYQKVDNIVGNILEKAPKNTTTIILSDHGFGPLYKEVHINHWLRDLGLLKLKKGMKRKLSRELLSEFGLARERIPNLLGLPSLKILFRIFPRTLVKKMSGFIPTERPLISDIDYEQTKAYSAGYVGQIFINLKGREPEGVVKPGKEYEELVNCIMEKLYELTDPENGEKIVEKIFKKEEVYQGEHANQAPDILFMMKDMTYIVRGHCGGFEGFEFGLKPGVIVESSPNMEYAWHRENGLFIASSPQIRKGAKIDNARIIDLMPTILHIMGVPIPFDLDGRVLTEIFKPDSNLAKREIQYQIPEACKKKEYHYEKEEEEEIKKRLKGLGYI